MLFHVVDAFTDRPFAGGPAGVCLLGTADWPEDTWMQQVAAEVNHPETAFVRRLGPGGGADWGIRWFAPLVEVGLCGHATLAAAHVLRQERGAAGALRFRSRAGDTLTAHLSGDGITLDFPAAPTTGAPVPEGLPDALGAAPGAVLRTNALGDLLAVLPDEAAVRALAPDADAVAALTRREGLRGVAATAPAAASGRGYDFVSRYFCPADGVFEDPVTGSAHTALAPYWAARTGRAELTGLQVSARTGRVEAAVRGGRVLLTGRAVTVLRGSLRA